MSLNVVLFDDKMKTMGGQNTGKIKNVLKGWIRGTVATQPWLQSQGVYRQLARKYLQNSWIERVGHGAYRLAGDSIDWPGGLHALQNQLALKIHAGAKTALELEGYAHTVPLGKGQRVWLFGAATTTLPRWFKAYSWSVQVRFVPTNLFAGDPGVGLTDTQPEGHSFWIRLSAPERAILETLSLVPAESDFEEAQSLMEGLDTLRPSLVQTLLEACRSIKAKRLFMHLAEKMNHPWVSHVDVARVNFGKGNRTIVPGGKFDSKYRITVPA